MAVTNFLLLSHVLKSHDAVYPGNSQNIIRPLKQLKNGSSCNTFEVILQNHNGTHIDFPAHFYERGKKLTDVSISELIFSSVELVDILFDTDFIIQPEHLKDSTVTKRIKNADAILFRTKHESNRGSTEYPFGPYLSVESAHWLRRECTQLKCIGLDTLSITSQRAREVGKEVHRILLGGENAPIVIEDMKLSSFSAQGMENTKIRRLFIVPLFVEQVDGMPCTAFAELANCF